MITGAGDSQADTTDTVPAFVHLPGRPELAERLRERLEESGHRAAVIDDGLIADETLVAVIRALSLAGVAAISSRQLAPEIAKNLTHAVAGFAKNGVLAGEEISEEQVLTLAGEKA
jgi:hypothetical protein